MKISLENSNISQILTEFLTLTGQKSKILKFQKLPFDIFKISSVSVPKTIISIFGPEDS